MNWRTVPLHKVASLESGFGFPREYQGDENQEFPFFRVSDMNIAGNEVLMENHSNTVSAAILKELGARAFPAGTVIFPKIGAAIATEKKRILTKPATYDNNVMGAVPKAGTNPKFLYYWFLQLKLSDQANPGHVPSIRKSVMEEIPFPVVAPSEQFRIVELLDEADRLRRLRRDADAKATRILPALFLKMFGDPATNPMRWAQATLGEFGVKARYGLGQPPKQCTSGLPLLRATNIDAGRIIEKNLIFVEKEDVPPGRNAFLASEEVLVVRSGAYTGDVAQVTGKWAGSVAGYDLVITPAAGWSGEFIEQFLLTPFVQRTYFDSQKGRAGQPHLNSTQLEATPAFNPPESLQNAFAEQVRAVRSLRDQCIGNAERLEQVFAVLLQRAFSGQLTAKWREAHMQELMAEMAKQSLALNLPMRKELEALS